MSARVDPILALLWSPFVATVLILIGLAIYAVSRIDRNRIARVRARENELTLAYIADVVQMEQAATRETSKARGAEWFEGGESA